MSTRSFRIYKDASFDNISADSIVTNRLDVRSDFEGPTFDYAMSFQTMDSTYFFDINIPEIPVTVGVTLDGKLVSVDIPTLSFNLQNPGFLVSSPSTTLPQSVRHSRAMPYAAKFISDVVGQEYTVYTFNDGTIVIGDKGFQPLPAGQHSVYGDTLSYKLDPPQSSTAANLKLFNKNTNVAVLGSPNDLLDFYNNDIYGNTAAFTFSGNPADDVLSPQNVNAYATVCKIQNGNMTVKNTTLVYQPPAAVSPIRAEENTISINPTNPDNMVLLSALRDTNVPVSDPSFNRFTLIRSYTFNGGTTWTTTDITKTPTSTGLPSLRSDPNGLFDSYGNYWLCYMVAGTADYLPPYELVFAVSTDGGVNFTVVGTTALASYLDYPRLAFGGDGVGGKALWFSVDLVNSVSLYVDNIVVGYIQVSGLGTYGTLTYSQTTGIGKDIETGTVCYIQVPEITATPDGDVYLLAPTQLFNGDSGNFGKSVLYKHVGGIADNAFVGPYDTLMTNIGGNDFNTSALGKPVPFQPNRGVFPNGARGIDYDATSGRLWVVSNNLIPNVTSDVLDPGATYNMSIFAIYSDNGGSTWSPEIIISNISSFNRALPSIRVNPTNGNKAFFWYDGRDGTADNGASVKPYGALLTGY